jgi:hypothetical protein
MEHAVALPSHSPKTRPTKPKAYSQCVTIQALVQKDIENPTTKPSIRAGCVRAWDILEERKRILRGKPLPGYLRQELRKQTKPTRRVALLAPILDEPKESPGVPDPSPR